MAKTQKASALQIVTFIASHRLVENPNELVYTYFNDGFISGTDNDYVANFEVGMSKGIYFYHTTYKAAVEIRKSLGINIFTKRVGNYKK